MNEKSTPAGTPPTDFTVDEETLRHGHAHRQPGHRPAAETQEQPDARGTQHRAPASGHEPAYRETMHDRLRSRLARAEGGD